MKDPGAAICESIASYLTTALSSVTGLVVLRGWPETDTQLDLSAGPCIAVTQTGPPEETPISPVNLDDVEDDAILVQTARLIVPFQLDAWAGYRAKLDALVAAIDDALANDLPYRPHLYLTATDYHGRPFTAERGDDNPDVDGDSASVGEWRHIWTLSVSIDRVQSIPAVAAVTIDATSSDVLTIS
jgi:hypothetical protein